MNRWLAFIPLAALVVVIAVGAFLLTREHRQTTFTEGMIGRPAPAFSLARLDGGAPITNETMRGRAYVINMFASWCTPCRAEHPQLIAMQAGDVEMLGVAYKDAPSSSARFLTELGNPYTAVAIDPEGQFGLQLGITGVPETFVIGPDGMIRAVYRGPLTQDVVQETILPALTR